MEPLRTLGRVLNHMLSGERSPDLGDLPSELAQTVRGLLCGFGKL